MKTQKNSAALVVFLKARPYPEGTVRSWHGKKYIKKNGHWDPVTDDTFRNSASSKKKQTRTVKGTPEMLTELKRLESGKRIFIDDLSGTRKKVFNTLTKEGLVSWIPAGDGEYKAKLTAAGEKALDRAHGAEARKKRNKGK